MSVTYINAELRRLVVARSEGLCEYCLIAEDDTFYGCQADHIISEKHGGPTQGDNPGFTHTPWGGNKVGVAGWGVVP